MSPRKKPRIMMISTHGYVSAEPEFGLPDTGGQVVYLLELSKCLGRLGFLVDIYTRRFEKQPPLEKVTDRVRILRQPCGGRDFIPKEVLCESIPEWVSNVQKFIQTKKLNYSFIDSHYWDAGLAGQMLADLLNIPHMHTPHSIGSWKRDNMDGDAEELEAKYNFNRRVREERFIFDQCDILIATTPQQRDIVHGDNYEVALDKIKVIPPGYDDTRFFPVSAASRQAIKRELELEGPIVMAIGRMAHNKGYDLLIQSMTTVLKRVPEARLFLAVGSTEPSDDEVRQIEKLRQLTNELRIADRVILRDYISEELMPDYYRAADVFALSSRYEPFGMTAVEAMACGTPTVITTEGGLWELVKWGREAIYENPFDPDSFGHAIATVLTHPRVAHQLSRGGTQVARARFTWTGIGQQILNLIDNVESRSFIDGMSKSVSRASDQRAREEMLVESM